MSFTEEDWLNVQVPGTDQVLLDACIFKTPAVAWGTKKYLIFIKKTFFLFCRIVTIWMELAPKIPVSCTLSRIFDSGHSEPHLEENGQVFL